MKILIAAPFFTGSHASWAKGFQAGSAHEVELLSLPGKHWKWRMHGAAVTLARQFLEVGRDYDLILTTDMLDTSVFLSLTRERTAETAVAVYFHENQLSYPWSPQDRDVQQGRDFHYGFINWTSVLSADAAWFNSQYNLDSFYEGVRDMLKAMPDRRELQAIPRAREKSLVVPLGIRLHDLLVDVGKKDYSVPVILWNHRWEYDKDPDTFFSVLKRLKENGVSFRLLVCGASYERYPDIFDQVPVMFTEELDHFGFAENRDAYRRLLHRANLLPVTSSQEFFGQSVMEAVAAGAFPILPDALAYPEHVPPGREKSILYAHTDDLEAKLTEACKNPASKVALIQAMQEKVMRCDWSVLAPHYDHLAETAVRAKTGINA